LTRRISLNKFLPDGWRISKTASLHFCCSTLPQKVNIFSIQSELLSELSLMVASIFFVENAFISGIKPDSFPSDD
jgi:hypothetical protein